MCNLFLHVLGINRHHNNLEWMYGFKVFPFIKICWAFVTPIFILVIYSLTVELPIGQYMPKTSAAVVIYRQIVFVYVGMSVYHQQNAMHK